ncbi:hypothetical protein SAMN04488097_0489 [Epilithonimonas lactis]|nr:hypothetical protein SAMN04488097_0489 [Epilithonimonas lactis]
MKKNNLKKPKDKFWLLEVLSLLKYWVRIEKEMENYILTF